MLRRTLIGAVALSAVMSLGLATVRADQAPSGSPSGSPQSTSPSNGDWFRPTSPSAPAGAQSGNGPADYPANQAYQWVDAATRAAMTRAIFGQAQIDLSTVIRRAQAHFERSKDFQNAQDAEQQAYADYLLARQKAVDTLSQNPRYATLIRMEGDLASRLTAGRQAHDLTHDDILAIAELKLSYSSDARSMEIAAINADPAVKDARDKMVGASRTLADMRSDFDYSLPDSTEVVAARHNMENARIAMLTAAAYLYSSSYATSAALDYATYINGPTQPRIYNYADPYGFGYGGGTVSPYWARY